MTIKVSSLMVLAVSLKREGNMKSCSMIITGLLHLGSMLYPIKILAFIYLKQEQV